MDHTTLYVTVFYFLTYRLAILLLGAASIYLGYRLFIKGFDHGAASPPRENGQTDQAASTGAELSAKAGQLNLTLKNAAPGSFFAAFGAIITTVILMGSPPQLDYAEKAEATQKSGEAPQRTLTVRGKNAEPIHTQIWQEDYPQLLQKAKDIVALAPENPNYHDTLASIYFLYNDYENAAASQTEAMKQAKAAGIREEGIAALEQKLQTYRQYLQ